MEKAQHRLDFFDSLNQGFPRRGSLDSYKGRQNKNAAENFSGGFICQDNQTARSTLLERRHLVQAYTWQGVPLTTALTRFTLGFHARLERLWE